jgi:hypothetical protein
MDPQFQEFIDVAEEIRTLGRWERVNSALVDMARAAPAERGWYVQVISGLLFRVLSEYSALKRAYQDEREKSSALLAWRARNLLELSVWARYCLASEGNVRRLYEDGGRDASGIYDAFLKWGAKTAQGEDWLSHLRAAKTDLGQQAAGQGIESLDDDYKPVGEAAREIGLGPHFPTKFKLLSKFAHPTAMTFVGAPDETKDSLQRDVFYSNGCLYFGGAFEALEELVLKGRS